MAQLTPAVDIGRKTFDLYQCVPLAKTAFAAYNSPIDKQAGENYNIKDTTVSFIDRGFLQEYFYGLLDVKVLRAAKLRASDMFGGPPDAFVVLSAEWPSLFARTRARRFTSIAKSTDPVWNTASLRAPIRDPATDTLHVQLYDEDVAWDDQLGSAVLKLSDLVGKPEQVITLQLSGPGVNKSATSTVTLSVRLRPLSQCTPADLDSVALVDTAQPTVQPGQDAAEGVVDVFKAMGADGKGATPPRPAYTFTDVARALGGEAVEELSPVVFLECWDTDTQVWIFRNVAKRKLVLAYRGTEKIRDWLTNVQVTAEKPYELIAAPPGSAQDRGEAQTHAGFLGAYKSVRRASNGLVQILTGGFDQPPGRAWRLLVTGHSLGGALATLSAYDLAVQKWEYEQRAKSPSHVGLALYTFGCPRVGNKAFVEHFNALLPDAWRVTNPLDMVTSVPTWEMYGHVGTAVQLSSQNRLVYNPPEVSMWDKMRSGQGVAQHLEPSYLETLFKVVQAALVDSPKQLSRL